MRKLTLACPWLLNVRTSSPCFVSDFRIRKRPCVSAPPIVTCAVASVRDSWLWNQGMERSELTESCLQ